MDVSMRDEPHVIFRWRVSANKDTGPLDSGSHRIDNVAADLSGRRPLSGSRNHHQSEGNHRNRDALTYLPIVHASNVLSRDRLEATPLLRPTSYQTGKEPKLTQRLV